MGGRTSFKPIDYYDFGAGGAAPLAALEERQVTAIEMLRSVAGPQPESLLDVGCGDGLFVAELDARLGLSARGWSLHGVDVSRAMVQAATARPYSFAECNVEDGLPFADGSFAIVTAGEVIEHVYDPDRLLGEIHRILRPGGHLLLTTPNLQSWYNRALFLAGIQPLFYETSTTTSLIGAGPLRRIKKGSAPVGHLRVFNRRALLDLLESQGFRPLNVRAAVFESIPRSVRQVDRLFNRWPSLASNLIVLASRD